VDERVAIMAVVELETGGGNEFGGLSETLHFPVGAVLHLQSELVLSIHPQVTRIDPQLRKLELRNYFLLEFSFLREGHSDRPVDGPTEFKVLTKLLSGDLVREGRVERG
jgi:hypothetical protein